MKFNNSNLSAISFLLVITVLLLVIIFWPLVIVFALNTLFVTLSIPYTFWTWLSVAVLQLSTFGGLATILRSIEKKL